MNIGALSGNLVATPELRVTQTGISVCSFTVAVRRPRTKDVADFFDCVAWRQAAEFIAKYFQKGSGIEVTGFWVTRAYEDKNGNKRKAFELQVDNVSFSGSKKADDSPSVENPAKGDIPTDEFREIPEEDLPF